MIYDDVRSYLQGETSITTYVSTRIHPIHLPQNPTLPAIAFTQIGSDHDHHLGGAAGSTSVALRLAVFSEDLQEAIDIAEALRLVLQGYRGAMGNMTVTFCTLEEQEDDADQPYDGSDTWVYSRASEYKIKYRETVPSF